MISNFSAPSYPSKHLWPSLYHLPLCHCFLNQQVYRKKDYLPLCHCFLNQQADWDRNLIVRVNQRYNSEDLMDEYGCHQCHQQCLDRLFSGEKKYNYAMSLSLTTVYKHYQNYFSNAEKVDFLCQRLHFLGAIVNIQDQLFPKYLNMLRQALNLVTFCHSRLSQNGTKGSFS